MYIYKYAIIYQLFSLIFSYFMSTVIICGSCDTFIFDIKSLLGDISKDTHIGGGEIGTKF